MVPILVMGGGVIGKRYWEGKNGLRPRPMNELEFGSETLNECFGKRKSNKTVLVLWLASLLLNL